MAQGHATGRDPHPPLEEKAEKIAAGCEGLVFLPYLMGKRSPVWDVRASGAFVGLNLFHTRAHLYRSVLEGVTMALRHNMEAGTRAAASLEPRLVVVAGAARSDLWMQIIADVTFPDPKQPGPVPVARPSRGWNERLQQREPDTASAGDH